MDGDMKGSARILAPPGNARVATDRDMRLRET